MKGAHLDLWGMVTQRQMRGWHADEEASGWGPACARVARGLRARGLAPGLRPSAAAGKLSAGVQRERQLEAPLEAAAAGAPPGGGGALPLAALHLARPWQLPQSFAYLCLTGTKIMAGSEGWHVAPQPTCGCRCPALTAVPRLGPPTHAGSVQAAHDRAMLQLGRGGGARIRSTGEQTLPWGATVGLVQQSTWSRHGELGQLPAMISHSCTRPCCRSPSFSCAGGGRAPSPCTDPHTSCGPFVSELCWRLRGLGNQRCRGEC